MVRSVALQWIRPAAMHFAPSSLADSVTSFDMPRIAARIKRKLYPRFIHTWITISTHIAVFRSESHLMFRPVMLFTIPSVGLNISSKIIGCYRCGHCRRRVKIMFHKWVMPVLFFSAIIASMKDRPTVKGTVKWQI